jgi:hypothetical protein
MHWVGRMTYLLGKGCTRVIPESAMWCFKLWKIMISRFGTLIFFAWQGLTMISMCCTLSGVCKTSWWTCSSRQLGDQWPHIGQGYYLADAIFPLYLLQRR